MLSLDLIQIESIPFSHYNFLHVRMKVIDFLKKNPVSVGLSFIVLVLLFLLTMPNTRYRSESEDNTWERRGMMNQGKRSGDSEQRGMMGGQKQSSRFTVISKEGELSPSELTALEKALQDEINAESFYQKVIEKFGTVRPFSMIVSSERQHISELENIYETYGIDVPALIAKDIALPASIDEACKISVQAEVDNIKLYDELKTQVTKTSVKEVFDNLAYASENMHLPAFERCGGR